MSWAEAILMRNSAASSALTLALFLTAPAIAGPAVPGPEFGGGVKVAGSSKAQQAVLHGDLDGDKVADDVYLVQVTGSVPKAVAVINLVPESAKGKVAAGEWALAVVLHPAGKAKSYLLRLGPMLDSPTWKKGDYNKLVTLGQGPVPPKDAKGKSIGMFTESGAIYYYYWNGKTFVGSNEGDEP